MGPTPAPVVDHLDPDHLSRNGLYEISKHDDSNSVRIQEGHEMKQPGLTQKSTAQIPKFKAFWLIEVG